MRLLVINPNSTASMTTGIVAAATAAAAPGVKVTGFTNSGAPPAIQGEEDGNAAAPGVIAACRDAAAADAAIIACFDDTGLTAARRAASIPVIGIGHAAFLTAMLHGGRFTVITTLPVSVPVIEANLRAYGLMSNCAQVRASGLPVLTLEDEPDLARTVLTECARAAAAEDGAHALVLGCAGMAAFAPAIQEASGLPAIDGVASAVGLARTILHAC